MTARPLLQAWHRHQRQAVDVLADPALVDAVRAAFFAGADALLAVALGRAGDLTADQLQALAAAARELDDYGADRPRHASATAHSKQQ